MTFTGSGEIPSGDTFPNALTGTPGDLFMLTSAENQPADADLLYVGLYTLVRNADGVDPQQEWIHLTEYKSTQHSISRPSGEEFVTLYGNKGVEDLANDILNLEDQIYDQVNTYNPRTATTVIDADVILDGSNEITAINVGGTQRSIAGGGTDITIASNGTDVNTAVSTVNFTGGNISVTQDGTDTGQVNISITADQPQITDFAFTGNAADVSGGVQEQWSVDFTGASDATVVGGSSNEEFYIHLTGNSAPNDIPEKLFIYSTGTSATSGGEDINLGNLIVTVSSSPGTNSIRASLSTNPNFTSNVNYITFSTEAAARDFARTLASSIPEDYSLPEDEQSPQSFPLTSGFSINIDGTEYTFADLSTATVVPFEVTDFFGSATGVSRSRSKESWCF